MKKLIFLSTFLFSVSAHALPYCPSDTSVTWNNCFGTFTIASGDSYVGEFKEDMRHGLGTYTFADGTKDGGFYMNGDYVPDICEGMGLVKGTESFGNCVNNLIDEL